MTTDTVSLTDPCRQVLRALAHLEHFEGSSRIDAIMVRVWYAEMTFSDAEDALQRLQLLGYVRSLSRGHWFITREGKAALRRDEEAAAHG